MPKVILYKQPQSVAQKSLQQQSFASLMVGAFGYVRELKPKEHAVRVQLMNGIMLNSVNVPSKEWIRDTSSSACTGGSDLPPKDTQVFIIFPYGIDNPGGAFVLASFFNIRDKAQGDFLEEGNEDTPTKILEGGLKITYDRTDAIYTINDIDDEKLVIQLDKKNKKVILTDWNDNKATLDSDGTVLEGKENSVTMDSDGISLAGKGNTVKLQTSKVSINDNLEVLQ